MKENNNEIQQNTSNSLLHDSSSSRLDLNKYALTRCTCTGIIEHLIPTQYGCGHTVTYTVLLLFNVFKAPVNTSLTGRCHHLLLPIPFSTSFSSTLLVGVDGRVVKT